MVEYLIVLVVAALVTWLLTPAVRRVAIRLGAVVSPDARRVHERPTPTLGGAAMYGGFLAAMAAVPALSALDTPRPIPKYRIVTKYKPAPQPGMPGRNQLDPAAQGGGFMRRFPRAP